jgi:RNA polymerase sigma factor (sigma-70 family)
MVDAAPRPAFVTTRWSLVQAAGASGDQALAQLCSSYWYPVYAFVRRQSSSAEDAEDLTQGFFARLIEKGDLAVADPARGRFRSFLLAACRHYLSNARDHARADRRGGRRLHVPLDVASAEQRYERALAHGETPERIFERQWCLTLLGAVLEDLAADYEARGQSALYARLSPFLAGADDAGRHREAASDLGMTPAAVKVAVHRLRRRYRDRLRDRVRETVASERELEEEIQHLFRSLAPAAP